MYLCRCGSLSFGGWEKLTLQGPSRYRWVGLCGTTTTDTHHRLCFRTTHIHTNQCHAIYFVSPLPAAPSTLPAAAQSLSIFCSLCMSYAVQPPPKSFIAKGSRTQSKMMMMMMSKRLLLRAGNVEAYARSRAEQLYTSSLPFFTHTYADVLLAHNADNHTLCLNRKEFGGGRL